MNNVNLYTITSTSQGNVQSFSYPIDSPSGELVQMAFSNLQVFDTQNYVVYYRNTQGVSIIIEKDITLRSLNAKNGDFLQIFPNTNHVQIEYRYPQPQQIQPELQSLPLNSMYLPNEMNQNNFQSGLLSTNNNTQFPSMNNAYSNPASPFSSGYQTNNMNFATGPLSLSSGTALNSSTPNFGVNTENASGSPDNGLSLFSTPPPSEPMGFFTAQMNQQQAQGGLFQNTPPQPTGLGLFAQPEATGLFSDQNTAQIGLFSPQNQALGLFAQNNNDPMPQGLYPQNNNGLMPLGLYSQNIDQQTQEGINYDQTISHQYDPFSSTFNSNDEVPQFQTGISFNYNTGFNTAIGDQDLNSGLDQDPAMFNSSVAIRANNPDQNIRDGTGTTDFMLDNGIVIDADINDDNANIDFGAVKMTGNELYEMWAHEGLAPYEVKVVFGFLESDHEPKTIKLFQMFEYKDVRNILIENFKLDNEPRYSFMFTAPGSTKFWLKEGSSLEKYQFVEGTALYVFKRDLKVMVSTSHYQPRMVNIDAENSVENVVEDLAKKLGIENPLGYSLYATEDDTELPLNPHLPIPEQTKHFNQLTLRREFFCLSRIDISTLETAMQTYKDAKTRFFGDNLFVLEEIALEFAALQFFIEADANALRTPTFPDNIHFLFPECNEYSHTLGPELLKYVSEYPEISKFNAIRKWLKLIRRYPGFGTLSYDCTVLVNNSKGSHSMFVAVEISPMSISIYDPDTNVLEDKISFTKILQLTCVEDNLSIVFFISKGITAKYTFVCDMAKEMNEVIDQQVNIIKKLMVQRAKRTELLPPIISSKYRVTLPTSKSLLATTDIPEYDYDINYTGELLTRVAEQNIGLEHDDNHIPFVCLAPAIYRFVFKDEILALLNISTGMTVFIINKMEEIELTYSNDRVETITLDMTKTVESLTADAFAKIKFPALTGYSFWKEMDDGTLFPLDVRYTIPEQIGDYKKLKLLRRFFIISGEILVSLDVSMMVMQETIKLISEGKTPIADPQLIELCVLYAYATKCNTPSDIDDIRDFSFLSVLMPPGRQMDEAFMVKLQQQVKMYPPKDKFQAIKKFIGIARALDMFGYESYPCKFKEMKRGHKNKTMSDFSFTLAPLYFLIGQNKPGLPPVYQIGYRYIINYQILDNVLIINFVADDHGNLMKVKLTFDPKETNEVVMLLDYNIKLLHDLLNQKEMMKRKMREEEVKMLTGGFVDQRGVIHGPMCDFYFTKDPMKLDNLEKEWIDLKYNGRQLAKLLSIWLKQPKDINYCVLYRTPDKDYQWIDYTRILKSYHPMRASTLILLEKNPTIKVIPIGSKTPQIQEVKIDISSSIGVLLQDLCQMFSIPMIPGLTLAYEKHGNLKYLDISRSIPEQANITEVFYIILRHFTFSTTNLDYETLWFLFLQTRECILRGIYKISSEDMNNLCFFQIAAFTNQTPNLNSIPQNDKEWVPAGQNKPSKSATESVFNVLMAQYVNLDSYQGAQLYIEYARKIKGFSVIVFNVEVDLGFESDEHPKQKLHIGQEKVTISYYDSKKLFLEFPIANILEVHGKINEIEIKYRDENYNAKSYFAFTEEATNIYYIFLEILNITKINYCNLAEKSRQLNQIMDPSNLYKVQTFATLIKSKGEFLEYSKLMSGFDVLQEAINKLDLDPFKEYIMMCEVANNFYTFVDLQAPIGVVNPTEKSHLYIFPRISRITVQNDAGEVEKIPIDLTKPLNEVIPRLANKFFIKYYVGYAIFKDWDKEKQVFKVDNGKSELEVLDLTKTLPEQTIHLEFLVFKRKYFAFTINDVKNIDRRGFLEIRKHILKESQWVSESKAIELAVYSILADAPNYEAAQHISINNVEKILPMNFKVQEDTAKKIKDVLKTSPEMSQIDSMRKYAATARTTTNFGCITCKVNHHKIVGIKTERGATPIHLFVCPFGIQGIELENNNPFLRCSYQNIISYTQISYIIQIKAFLEDGSISTMEFAGPDTQKIAFYLDQYIIGIRPLVVERNRIQSMVKEPGFKNIIDSLQNSQLSVKISPYVCDPYPLTYPINENWEECDALRYCLVKCASPQDVTYSILKYDEENGYEFIQRQTQLNIADISPKSVLYVVPNEISGFVSTKNGNIVEISIHPKVHILESIALVCEWLQYGPSFGVTYYGYMPKKGLVPLDFLHLLPAETPFYFDIFIQRRFPFMFSFFMEDQNLYLPLYAHMKDFVINGNNVIPIEAVIELGICQLYAECHSEEETKALYNNYSDEKAKKTIPKNVSFSQNVMINYRKSFLEHPQMSQFAAIYRFLCIIGCLPDFGAEKYEAIFTRVDASNTPQQYEGAHVTIKLSLQGIVITSVTDNADIHKMSYDQIISVTIEQKKVNLKFEDDSRLFHDINLESKNNEEIVSYINDIMYLIKQMVNNRYEILYDDTINFNLLGFVPSFYRIVQINDIDLDDEDYDVKLHNFDEVISVDVVLDHSDNETNNDDIMMDEEEFSFDYKKVSEENYELQNYIMGDENENDITWRANVDVLNETRRKGALQAIVLNLDGIMDNIQEKSADQVAADMSKLKETFSTIQFDENDEKDVDLRNRFNNLFNTVQTASMSAIPMVDISVQLTKDIKNIISNSNKAIEKTNVKILELKNTAQQNPPIIINEKQQQLATNLCLVSGVEEKFSNFVISNSDVINKMGFNTKDLMKTLTQHSTLVTKLACEIKSSSDSTNLIKLLPQVGSINQQLDILHQFNKNAALNNLKFEESQNLELDLQKLLANTEKLVALTKATNNNNPELVQKSRQYQIYLGDYSKLDQIIEQIRNILSTSQPIFDNPMIKNNEQSSKLFEIIQNKIDDGNESLRKQFSALNKNPNNEAARTSSINTLYSMKDTLSDFIIRLNQFGSTIPEANSATQLCQTTIPLIDDCLLSISTANITPAAIQQISTNLTELATDAMQTAQSNIGKFNQMQIQQIQTEHQSLVQRLNLLNQLNQQFSLSPTNGELVKGIQHQLISIQKDIPRTRDYISLIQTQTNSPTLAKRFNLYEEALNSTILDKQSGEGNVVCPHLSKYEQSLVEAQRLINQLSLAKDSDELRFNPLNETVSTLRERLIKLREEQQKCRRELKQRPYHQPFIDKTKEILDETKDVVDKIVEISPEVQKLVRDSKIQQISAICKASTDVSLETIATAGLGDFRKPPEKELVNEILQNVISEVKMFTKLLETPELKSKPKLAEELAKRIQMFSPVGVALEEQAIDPTIEFIPVAEKLKQLNADMKNLLAGIQSFKQNSAFTSLVEQTQSNLDYSLIKTPPNIDLAIRSIDENIVPIQQLSKLLKEIQSRASTQADLSAVRKIKNWNSLFDQAFIEMSQLKQKQKPNEQDLMKVKDVLLKINAECSQVPIELKPHLQNKDFGTFGKSISAVRNHSQVAVNCVRLLPTSKKFEFDSSSFKPVVMEGEIPDAMSELIKNYNNFVNVIQSAQQRSDIKENVEANSFLDELLKLMKTPNIQQVSNISDDRLAIEALVKAKELMPQCLEIASKVTSYLNNEAFQQVMKLISDNVSKCHMMLTRPHLTKLTAPKIVSQLQQTMDIALPNLAQLMSLQSVLSNPAVTKLCQTYQQQAVGLVRQMPSQNVQQQQQTVDQLNNLTAQLLQCLDNIPGAIEAIDKLEPIYSLTNKYTTAQRIPIKVAGHLIPRKPKDLDDQTVPVFNLVAEQINSPQINNQTALQIIDYLTKLQDTKQGMPLSIINNARNFIPCVKTLKPVYASDAARTVAISSNEPDLRQKMLQILAVKDCMKASTYFAYFSQMLNDLDRTINSQLSNIPSPLITLYSQLKSDIQSINPSNLSAIPTFDNAITQYVALHNLDTSVNNFIAQSNGVQSLTNYIQSLMKIMNEFSPWLKQSDLTMESLVYTCADNIARNLEDIMQKDELGRIPDTTQNVLDQLIPILKNKQRGIAFNQENSEILSNILTNFSEKDLASINKNAPPSIEKDQVNESFNYLTKMKPVMRIWSASKELIPNEVIRNETEVSLSTILRDLEGSLKSSSVQAEQIIAVSSADAALANLLKKLQANNSNQNKAVLDTMTQITKMQTELKKQSNNKQGVSILEFKNLANSALTATRQIAQISTPKITLNRLPNQNAKLIKLDMTGLKEQSTQQTMQAVTQLLLSLQASSNNVNPASVLSDFGSLQNTKIEPVDIKTINNSMKEKIVEMKREKMLQDPSSTLIKIDSKLDTKSPMERLQNVDQKLSQTSQITTEIFKNLMNQHQKFSLIQRMNNLQNQQRTIFTDIQSINNEISHDFTINEIQDNLGSIQSQLDLLTDTEKLSDIQIALNPKQVLIQQAILSDACNLVSQSETKLPTNLGVQTMVNNEMNMLENFLIKLDPSSTASNVELADVKKFVERGLGVVNLVTKLQTLKSEIMRINPEIFRYSKTIEGFKAMNEQIPSHEIIEVQNIINDHLNMLNTSETLNLAQKSLTPDKTIKEIRLITNLLEMMSEKLGEKLMSDSKILPSESSIYSQAIYQQFEQINRDTVKSNIPSLVDLQTHQKIENFVTNSLCKLDLAQKIMSLQQTQLMMYPQTQIQPLKATDNVKQEIPMIAKQLELLNDTNALSQTVACLSPQSINIQQNLLSQLLAQMSTKLNVLDEIKETQQSKVSNAKIISKVMEKELETLFAEPEKIQELEISQTSALPSLQKFEFVNSAATKTVNLSSLISTIRQSPMTKTKNNQILSMEINNCSPEQIQNANDICEQLTTLNEIQPENVNSLLMQTNPIDQSLSVGILTDKLKSLLELSNKEDVVNDIAMENRVFDHASLIQRDPKQLNTKIDIEKTNVDQIDSMKTYVQLSSVDKLINLQRERLSIMPGIVEAATPKMIEKIATDVTPEKMDLMLKQLLDQLTNINQEKCQEEIKNMTTEDLVLQQLVISSSIDAALDEQSVKPIIENNMKDTKDIENVKSDEVAKEILTQKFEGIVKIPSSLKDINLSTNLDLAKINADVTEQKARAKLNYQLLTAIKSIESKSPVIITKATSKPVNFEKSEISAIQEKAKVYIDNPQEIHNIDEKDEDFLSKLLVVMQSLSDTIKPVSSEERKIAIEAKALGVTKIPIYSAVQTQVKSPATPKSSKSTPKKGKKSSVAKKSSNSSPLVTKTVQKVTEKEIRPISLFDQQISLPTSDLTQSKTEVKVPTMDEIISSLVDVASNTVENVSLMSTTPLPQAQTILNNSCERAAQICSKLLESNSLSYDPDVNVLVQVLPDLVGSMSRILPILPKNVKQLLPDDPSVCITHVSNIQKASIELEDMEKLATYRKSLSDLLTIISKVEAAFTDEKYNPVAIASNIVAAVKSNDISKANLEIINFQAAKVQEAAKGLNTQQQFQSIEPVIAKINPAINLIHYKPTDPNAQKSVQVITSNIPTLVSLINKTAKSPFEQIAKISTIPQVIPAINESLSQIERSTHSLSKAISGTDKSSVNDNIIDLVRNTADTQNLLIKGIDIKAASFPAFVDFVSNLNSSVSHLNTIVSASSSSSATPLAIKRGQRRLARVITNLKEKIADPTAKQENKSMLEKKKVSFVNNATTAMQQIFATLSLKATATADENFNAVMKLQLPEISKNIKSIKESAVQLKAINTNSIASNEFQANLDSLLSKFDTFIDSASKTQDISELTTKLVDISENLVSTVDSVSQMSDVKEQQPDTVSSDKIPVCFILPTPPVEQGELTASELCKDIKNLSIKFMNDYFDFTTKSLSAKTSNSDLADLVNNLNNQLRYICTKTQNLEIQSSNFERKSDIEKLLFEIANNFSTVIRTVRLKFLLSCPDFDSQAKECQKNIEQTFSQFSKVVEIIGKEESAAEELRKHFGIKFSQAIGPLTEALHKLESSSKTAAKLPKGKGKEKSQQMLELATKAGESVKSVMMWMKEHPTETNVNIDVLADFVGKVTEELENVDTHCHDLFAKKGKIDEHVFVPMTSFSKLLDIFNNSIADDVTPALNTAITSCCNAASTLASTVEAPQEMFDEEEQEEGNVQLRIKSSFESVELSDEDLMKKLILEANVVKARLLLNRFENKLSNI